MPNPALPSCLLPSAVEPLPVGLPSRLPPKRPSRSAQAQHPAHATPRCGTCRTCTNPKLKKACETNRDRARAGLKPITSSEKSEAPA